MKHRLAIVSTHPIQYYAPLFRRLNSEPDVEVKAFYTWSQAQQRVEDKGFGLDIQWDIPLLEGYAWEFVQNTAKNPGLDHFSGLKNPQLIDTIRQWQPSAVLVVGWNYRSHLMLMRWFKGRIPVLFRGDSHLLDEHRGLRRLLRRISLRFVYRYIDMALYVGTANKAYFEAHGVKTGHLAFVPHAIDNERFDNNQYEAEAQQWRAELGIEADSRVVLFAGKFEPKKNPLLLLEAAEHLAGYPLTFVFAGGGVLEQTLRKRSKNLKNVLFLPFQNQSRMPILYRLANLFVLPSSGPGETWGLAVNEAMASHRAVIVSNRCGCASDLVEPGGNGYVFEADKLNELIKSILKAFESDAYKRLGQRSAEIIAQWSLEQATHTIVRQLNQILSVKC